MSELNEEQKGMDIMLPGAPKEGVIDKIALGRAHDILTKYREAKKPLDDRVAESERWWMLQQWDVIGKGTGVMIDPTSNVPVRVSHNTYRQTPTAWLVNAIIGAQADAVEAYPEPNILPREEGDEELAAQLSKIVPVILSQADFEDTYSANQWRKLKAGTAVYGTFWDKDAHNGLGEVVVRKISFLNLFYQPGIDDLQKSQNIFHTEMIDRETLISQYPWLKGQDLTPPAQRGVEAKTIERVPKEDMVEVVDWYYHRYVQGVKILHYCKFVGMSVLYATENDTEPVTDEMGNIIKEPPAYVGLYDDAEFPFDVDALYPLEGSPAGMGMVDIGKGVQENIDRLEGKIVQVASMGATPRYFDLNGSINEAEFADWEGCPIVHVKGASNINEVIQQVQSPQLDGMFVNVLNDLKEELRQVLGATDVAQGTAPSGVVAASALAILDENAGKPKRASTRGSYRAYKRIVMRVIERIRQFYDAPRTFRILGQDGSFEYKPFDNSMLKARQSDPTSDLWTMPIFDIEVKPQKETAYTRMAQNEMAMQLFGMGVFSPQAAEQARQMIELMDFKDKDKILNFINEGQTMLNLMRQYQTIALQLASQYDPQQAMALMQQIQQQDPEGAQMMVQQMAAPAPGQENQATKPGDALAVKREEAAHVARAREQAQQSGQPR